METGHLERGADGLAWGSGIIRGGLFPPEARSEMFQGLWSIDMAGWGV